MREGEGGMGAMVSSWVLLIAPGLLSVSKILFLVVLEARRAKQSIVSLC